MYIVLDYGFDAYTNAINLEREYYQVFSCEFNLLYYPFDTQTCPLILEPTGNSKTFLLLTEGTHKYLGPTELTQYFVR